jgi:mono/diheme cytochrome c family protein
MYDNVVRTTVLSVLRLLVVSLILLAASGHARMAAADQGGSAGSPTGTQSAADGAQAGDELDTLAAEGQDIYHRDCFECHTDGGMGPTLNGRTWLKDMNRVLKILLQGGGDMPEFRSTLTDREIAAVATYIRNAWDNRFGVVLESEVRKAREAAAETR